MEAYRTGAARRGGRYRADGGPVVLGDEGRLVQVVSNLVENALRCTEAGGSVTIVVSSSGAIGVRDTGPGLAPDDVPHAFERFYLYERCGKDRPVGTGLGLAIVKELVEAMHGEVTVASEIGTGTVFAITLPLASGANLEAGAAPGAEGPA